MKLKKQKKIIMEKIRNKQQQIQIQMEIYLKEIMMIIDLKGTMKVEILKNKTREG